MLKIFSFIGIFLFTLTGVHADAFDTRVKEAITDSKASNIWVQLVKDNSVEVSGTDEEIRPYFVSIQALVEQALASELQKSIKTAKGIIHTPMPATPLCSKGEISKGLVDPSIETDLARLLTVKTRPSIVRDYLFQGGDLYIVYPKDGFYKRSEEQQQIYRQELVTHSNHLFDLPLACESIPNDLVGATYLFEDQLGNRFVFAIQMTQANSPQDQGQFGLWFGRIEESAIQKRLAAVAAYLKQNGAGLHM